MEHSQIPSESADTHEARVERSLKAQAHNPSNTPEGRLRAAEKLAELHSKHSDEKIDPKKEAEIGEMRRREREKQREMEEQEQEE